MADKAKFSLPKRKYCSGEKKMVSMRLPKQLMEALDKLADDFGWTTTDLAQTALDEFVQWAEKASPKSRR